MKRQICAFLAAACLSLAAAECIRELKAVPITQEDIPLLDAPIDRARFYIPEEGKFYSTILTLNADMDMHTLAVETISALQYHLAEG